VPQKGSVFVGWHGASNLSNSRITIPAQFGLELVAQFAPSPFPASAGWYAAELVSTVPGGGETGHLSLKLSASGRLVGRLAWNGKTYPFATRLDGSGYVQTVIRRKHLEPLDVRIFLDADSPSFVGDVTDGSAFSLFRAVPGS
jgi:hypothetical protein